MKKQNYKVSILFLAFMASSDLLNVSRQPNSLDESSNILEPDYEKTLSTLSEKTRAQLENVKALNELNRPGRNPINSHFTKKRKPVLPPEGIFKTPSPLVEVLGYLETSSDFSMLNRRAAEVWNFSFFTKLEGGTKTFENEESLIASMYNLETYIAFLVWVQIHEVQLEDQEEVYKDIMEQLVRYKKQIAEKRILVPGKNDLVESVEQKLKAEIQRKVFSSLTFKTFLNKVKLARKGFKLWGAVGAVTSLIDLISEYSNFYSESEALRAELRAINVPHDRIVPIVIR